MPTPGGTCLIEPDQISNCVHPIRQRLQCHAQQLSKFD